MEEVIFKPGQRVTALVDGVPADLVFTLETEEKGDDLTHWWRYDKPYFPLVPFDAKVEAVGVKERKTKKLAKC